MFQEFFHLWFLTVFEESENKSLLIRCLFRVEKRGLEIASISTFHILFITAWNDVSCYVYHANLVIFFRLRKKDRVCLLGEGPYSPFRYIFHAIHLLAI